MNYTLLGNTGLRVSELCLDTMTFGVRGLLYGPFQEAVEEHNRQYKFNH